MLGRCEELIAQPGAPNLYWALSSLPSPVIDFRHEIDNERKLCENMIPELAEAADGPAPDGRRMGDAPVADARPDRELGSRSTAAAGA